MKATTKHPPKNSPERQRDLATIHQTAREIGLSEFAYRALLTETTGRDSCLLMTSAERRQIIDTLEAEAASRRPAPPEVVTDAQALEILGW